MVCRWFTDALNLRTSESKKAAALRVMAWIVPLQRDHRADALTQRMGAVLSDTEENGDART